MKFCKNLQRVVDISDPAWAPYWTNYKMLKKLIKELPSLVPSDDVGCKQRARSESQESGPSANESSSSIASLPRVTRQQHHGDKTTEAIKVSPISCNNTEQFASTESRSQNDVIEKAPGEVAFFKLLHSEFKKATHFFEKAQEEFIIRLNRVTEGMKIMKRPNSIMVNEKWSLMARSVYKLYKDLLLFETFAIMTYCSFSKILKKHDKVTGFDTRNAFMAHVVNKANFTSYPILLDMISSCERLYEEVSQNLVKEGKEGLYEDERLFINMIHRLNEQCMDSAEAEGVPGRQEVRRPNAEDHTPKPSGLNQHAVTSLQMIVAEMADAKTAGQVSDGIAPEAGTAGRKRPSNTQSSSSEKRNKS